MGSNGFWMAACEREFYIASKLSQSSSFVAAGLGMGARCRPTKFGTCSVSDYIRRISRRRNKLHVLGWSEIPKNLCSMLSCYQLSWKKKAPGMPWIRKWLRAVLFTDVHMLLAFHSTRSKLDRPWYKIAPITITSAVRPLCRSISHCEMQSWPT